MNVAYLFSVNFSWWLLEEPAEMFVFIPVRLVIWDRVGVHHWDCLASSPRCLPSLPGTQTNASRCAVALNLSSLHVSFSLLCPSTPPHPNPRLSFCVKLDLDSQGPVWPPPADHTMGDRLTVWVVVRVCLCMCCVDVFLQALHCCKGGILYITHRHVLVALTLLQETSLFFSFDLETSPNKNKGQDWCFQWPLTVLISDSTRQNPQWNRSFLKYL